MMFPEFIKRVRLNLNLSQQQLAQELSVSFTTINRWENGHVVPSNLALRSFIEFCISRSIEIPKDIIEKR